MNIQNSFSDQAISSLKYYVYALIDPRDNKVFYYGKGIGNRVYSHEREANEDKDEYSRKINKIHDIENSGYSVIRRIVNAGFETEAEAFAAEVALINNADIIGLDLTNAVGGHHSLCGTVEEIEVEYGNHPIELKPQSKILVVNINKSFDRNYTLEELYKSSAGAWEFNEECINKAEIILFEYENIIRLAIKDIKWDYITPQNIDKVKSYYTFNFDLNSDRYSILENKYIHKTGNGCIRIPRYISECIYNDEELNEKYLGMKIINLEKKGRGLRPAHCKDFL